MKRGLTVERAFHVTMGQHSRNEIRDGEAPEMPSGRIPRVAKLMVLAIRFDHLIREGVVSDQAELARVGHVSRARLTQIMNLLNLAPDIQEQILFLPQPQHGRDAIAEKHLRVIVTVPSWNKQRHMWGTLEGNSVVSYCCETR